MINFKSSDIEEKKASRVLFWSLSLLFIAAVVAAGSGLYIQNRYMLQAEMLSMARSHINNIVLTRRWNASYGGVYVRKAPGTESNPFLENPDLHTMEGVTLTLKNPALMTREISELASRQRRYTFHITSLKPLNPANAPDEFERQALEKFERGKTEAYTRTRERGEYFFSYIAPLYVEESCLRCHACQGYSIGDVRGGIRVKFSIQKFEDIRKRTVLQFLLIAACFTGVLLSLVYFLMQRFELRLNRARERIRDMAVKDPLTGIYNRRYMMSRLEEELDRMRRTGRPLGCILLDIDHFKKINDQYGHLFGDEVLKELCERVSAVIRPYDTFARYGGEEFVILLSGADVSVCMDVAARVVKAVRDRPFGSGGTSCRVTLSAGVSCAATDEANGEILLKKADDALYKAKQRGRDCIVLVK